MHKRKIPGESLAACHLNLRAVSFSKRAGGALQLCRAHVVRWRVGEVAAQRDRLDDAAEVFAVDAVRHDQLDGARFRLAVAGELIGPQRYGQRRQPCTLRVHRQNDRPGRWHAGELAGAEQVLHGVVGVFEAKQDAGKLAIRSGNDQVAAGLGLKPEAARTNTCARSSRIVVTAENQFYPCLYRTDRLRFSGVHEYWMHGHSAASRIDGLGA